MIITTARCVDHKEETRNLPLMECDENREQSQAFTHSSKKGEVNHKGAG